MEKVKRTRKIIQTLVVVFSILLAVILCNFAIHVYHVKNYNAQVRTVTPSSLEANVLVDLHPRGQATDAWEKDNAFPDVLLRAKIYEATLTNSTGATLKNWSLRIDIQDDCYLNNAWNGLVEIHQRSGYEEKVQTLSLLDYDIDAITLDAYLCGQDLLIPLSKGDYVVYYPSADYMEDEIPSTTEMSGFINIGLIFYSLTGDENLSNYELTYSLEKSIWSGTEAVIFRVLAPLWLMAIVVFTIVIIIFLRFEKRIDAQNDITTEFLFVFSNFVDAKDPSMNGHSRRIAKMAKELARNLGMRASDCENVYYSALVHDIGKCYVPDYILKKRGKFTAEEYEVMKTHTSKGAKMLEGCVSIPGIAEGALYHHERYDGTGYPTGKAGEEIPLIGRIICIADAYDAMTTSGDYSEKMSKEEAIKELKDNKGTQFDPFLVDIFIEILEKMNRNHWEME